MGTSSAMSQHPEGLPPRRSEPNRRPPLPPTPVEGGIETQRIFTIFGSNSRGGYWEPPEQMEVLAVFGGVKLDFRDANLYSGVTVVNCFALFGGVDILVPPDLEIDANGTGLFGGFDHQVESKRKGFFRRSAQTTEGSAYEYDPDEDPPLLRVRGFALFGGVTIRVK